MRSASASSSLKAAGLRRLELRSKYVSWASLVLARVTRFSIRVVGSAGLVATVAAATVVSAVVVGAADAGFQFGSGTRSVLTTLRVILLRRKLLVGAPSS